MASVAVVGAGIGGLTVAAALENRGFEVSVYEQFPELRQHGSGLSLYTNAVTALRSLGLWSILEEIAEPVEQMVALSAEGRVLTEIDTRSVSARFSSPNVNVHRGELLTVLGKTVSDETITFGARCVGFDQDGLGVRLRFADGTEAQADLLVAADGAGSAIRNVIHKNEAAEEGRRWSGWQGVALSRSASIPEATCMFVLNGRNVAGLLPLAGDRLHWFIDDHRPEPLMQDSTEDNLVYEALAGVIGLWPSVVREAVAATLPDSVSYDMVRDRLPSRQWGEGRVTLLGDAAHPMLPTLGQGACQSIEDAAALIECLESDNEIEAALREYERRRSSRAANFVLASRRSAEFRSRVPPALRDAVMRALPRRLLSYSFSRSISPAKIR